MGNEDAVVLDGPKVLTLAPAHVAAVLDALAELPFKRANPVIVSIMGQLRRQSPAAEPVAAEG